MKKRQKELSRILEDKTHGSAAILDKLNQHLLQYYSDSDYINFVIIKTKKMLSQFSIIQNYLKDLQNVLDKNNSITLKVFLVEFGKLELIVYGEIFDKLQKSIPTAKRFLTLSHSKTILEVLKSWKENYNRKLEVIVCESRPVLEGRILAKELVKQGINVEMITDAMISLKVPEVHAVLLGADQILRNGNIVNKTGSRSLAIIAKYNKVPVYVLSSNQKVIEGNKIELESDDPDQVWKYKHTNLRVSNNLFEEVENKLITKIITD
jgi:hypothetical protein